MRANDETIKVPGGGTLLVPKAVSARLSAPGTVSGRWQRLGRPSWASP